MCGKAHSRVKHSNGSQCARAAQKKISHTSGVGGGASGDVDGGGATRALAAGGGGRVTFARASTLVETALLPVSNLGASEG